MEIAIIGGGIVGLALALNLEQRGLVCHVYEAVPEVKELGVGITLLPHAMRELALLGLQEALEPLGIENEADPVAALRAYEDARSAPAARVVRTNRTAPPDFINIRVEELTGDRPFDQLDDFISQQELRALSDRYKRIAGYSIEDLATPAARSAT